MLLISLILIDDVQETTTTVIPTTVSGETGVSISDLTATPESSSPFSLSTDNWFGFFGPILIII
ncbi:MAG: hypothetical protein WAW59_01490 [Patescibacteria group bacterium]